MVFFLFLAPSPLFFALLTILALILLTFLARVLLFLLLPLLSGLILLVLLAFGHFKLLFEGVRFRAEYREGVGATESGLPWFWLRGIPKKFLQKSICRLDPKV